MRTYRCHKQVQAAKIEAILPPMNPTDKWQVQLEGGHIRHVWSAWIYSQEAKAGGYYVQDRGRDLYLTAAEFEADYTREQPQASVPITKGWSGLDDVAEPV